MGSGESIVLSGSAKKRVFVILGITALLAISVFIVDWMNYFNKTNFTYTVYAKPFITLLAFVLLLMAGRNKMEKKDWQRVLWAFLCMIPTDILMSLVVISPALSVGSVAFMIGGVLSIVAHIFLIIRMAQGFKFIKKLRLKDYWLPLMIYGSAVVILLILWQDIVKVGHAAIAPAYTAFFCTTVWVSWEAVRQHTLPKINARMAAIAATCWYATEILGEIYNLGLGNLSEITFCLVWVFYGTNVVLWALSTYRWTRRSKNRHK
jgi:hypothetical protein